MEVKMKYIYLCENSLEGILSCIYRAWEDSHGHSKNEIQLLEADYNRQLFCEYIEVITDKEKAEKVARTITQKISVEFYRQIMQVSVSYNPQKADIIYRCIILGLYMGKDVLHHLGSTSVSHLFSLSRNVTNEIHHFNGFLRFMELRNGLLFAKIRPKNDILYFLSEHFCDRFPDEDFIIADVGRNSLLLHAKGLDPIIQNRIDFDIEQLDALYSDDEQLLQNLFQTFIDAIQIDSRKNPKLQQQNLPLRFREFMNEFH